MSMLGFCFAPNKLYNIAYEFNGSTNYLKRTSNLSGIANSKVGFVSCFLRYSDIGGVLLNHYDGVSAQNLSIGLTAANPASIICAFGDGLGNSWVFESTSTITINTWYHIMITWDTNFPIGSKVARIYANDTNLGVTETLDSMGAVNIDYTSNSPVWSVGGQTSGVSLFEGCLGQFVFGAGQSIDVTDSAVRRKFSNVTFNPISIGRNGQTPTGTKPTVYLTSSIAGIGVNSGSGGNFDSVNGTFAACGTTP